MASSSLRLDALRRHPWLRAVHHVRTVGSTNSEAAALLAKGETAVPLLYLADQQTAGRGRGQHRWWSREGSLTFSLVLERSSLILSPESLYSLGTGCAILHALRRSAQSLPLKLKWPNDVYLDDKKIGGILIETGGPGTRFLIVGIGLNINTDFKDAPPDIQSHAASIAQAVGRPLVIDAVIHQLLRTLGELYTNRMTADQILCDYRQWNLLAGRRIRLTCGNESHEGICVDIDDGGALMVRTDIGIRTFASGSVDFGDEAPARA